MPATSRYAEDTDVPAERTLQEIDRLISKYGGRGFGYLRDEDSGEIVIAFRTADRNVRFRLPLPPLSDYRLTPTRMARTPSSQRQAWEQAVRARYRALLLVIKGRFEAVATGIETFDTAFMPYLVLPDNTTVGEWVASPMADAFRSGAAPTLPRALDVLALPARSG